MSSSSGADARFLTTRWSVVLDATGAKSPRRSAALEDLARAYWYPLYAFARRSGLASHEAADVVQDHFARILERGDLAAVDPTRGRFRNWLMTGLRNRIADRREHDRAAKRGGNVIHVPIEPQAAEARFASDPQDPRPLERVFEREWALAVIERATARLRAEQDHAGKQAQYLALLPSLHAQEDTPPHADVARTLGITENAVKVALHRLRRRLGELIRDEVGGTLREGEDVEDEIRQLLAALSAD